MRVAIWESSTAEQQRKLLARPALAKDANVATSVTAIIERVRREGDAALLDLTAKLDGVGLQTLEVDEAEIDESGARLSAEQRAAIEAAARNIETFHRLQLPTPIAVDTAKGVRCERVSRPIESVGLYVPAGSAPLPSTALMLGVPAQLAGCGTRVLCSPPQADGRVHPAVLYAARVTRVQRVFKLGGAQAVAALAYGTETVPKVDKIFGPGNTWVTEAKAQVDRDPAGAARDYPAGPSEVLVIGDSSANPAFVASDLLSQAEHGADSQVLLLTTSPELASAVVAEIEKQKAQLTRRTIVDAALASSSAVVVPDLQTAFEIANRYAPEHLILQIEKPRDWLPHVRNAGSVFLGPWTPESVGDYCSGTNHVLPTYGFARRYSSLGVGDFLRSMTVQELTVEGLQNIGPIATTLAELEGLDAHASAVDLRLKAVLGARR
jgi:histidinol dehydrogenase